MLVYRLDDRLFFANASYIRGRIREAVRGAPDTVRWFVFDAGGLSHIDATGLHMLAELRRTLCDGQITLVFARLRGPMRQELRAAGLLGADATKAITRPCGLPSRQPGRRNVSYPPNTQNRRGAPRRLAIDGSRLWIGGLAAAVVAGLVAIVGVLIARGLFDVPLMGPASKGAFGDGSTIGLAALAALGALLATGLMHLLLLGAPQPFQFFTWILTLVALIAAIVPFLTDAETDTKVATAAINVAIGVTIGSLVSSVARSALRAR